jgi:hypothetical protein
MPGLKLTIVAVSGEQAHAKGADGALRAKRWLEATTRANVPWINPDPVAVPKLSFSWVDGDGSFSFDLGGTLIGGEIANQEFLAESKKYDNASHQNSMYNEYLAKCYVARRQRPDRCDNFMWITWSAFATTTWSDLVSVDRVRSSVLKECKRALGVEEGDAAAEIDDALCKDVAARLWILVLSDRQEKHLILSAEHQGLIRKHIAEEAART